MTVASQRRTNRVRPPSPSASAAIKAAASEDHASVVDLAQRLVRTPSRAGVDPYEPIFELIESWLIGHGLAARRLHDDAGELVGLACDVQGVLPGPRYVLDACVDTPPFGDLAAWRYPPTSGVIEDGWLYGRGSSDCKTAVAIFCHIAAQLSRRIDNLHGSVTLLFDADEHTGKFNGAKQYFSGKDAPTDVAGVMIGYPGLRHIVIGGRGFLRAEMVIHGTAGHTGAGDPGNGNAVSKAAQLVHELDRHREPAPVDPEFGLSPKLTVTAIHGGEGYSIVPDRCVVSVDTRLTPQFDKPTATELLERIVAEVDRQRPTTPTTISYAESWPAFRLSDDSPIAVALRLASQRHLVQPPQWKVAGPSNIGNYLASFGIDATAGFGVAYRNLHGTDECIEVATIPVVQAVYHEAVLTLLS